MNQLLIGKCIKNGKQKYFHLYTFHPYSFFSEFNGTCYIIAKRICLVIMFNLQHVFKRSMIKFLKDDGHFSNSKAEIHISSCFRHETLYLNTSVFVFLRSITKVICIYVYLHKSLGVSFPWPALSFVPSYAKHRL